VVFLIFFDFFYNFFKKIKIATCQSDLVPRDRDSVMW